MSPWVKNQDANTPLLPMTGLNFPISFKIQLTKRSLLNMLIVY